MTDAICEVATGRKKTFSEDWKKKKGTNIVVFHCLYEKLVFSDLGPGG